MAATSADDIFKCNFVKENVWISISIFFNFVPEGRIDNKTSLVQVMARRRIDDKPLPEPIMTQLSEWQWHIYESPDLNKLMCWNALDTAKLNAIWIAIWDTVFYPGKLPGWYNAYLDTVFYLAILTARGGASWDFALYTDKMTTR